MIMLLPRLLMLRDKSRSLARFKRDLNLRDVEKTQRCEALEYYIFQFVRSGKILFASRALIFGSVPTVLPGYSSVLFISSS